MFALNMSTVYYILEIAISMILPQVQSWITQQQTLVVVTTYVCLLIIKEFVAVEYKKAVSHDGLLKARKFHQKTLEKYCTLSQTDRESESIHVFLDAFNGMKNVIQMENSWFRVSWKTFASIIATTMSTMYATRSLTPIIYIMICYASFYWFIKSHMVKMKKDREYSKNKSRRIAQQNRLEYSKLRLGQGNIQDIICRDHELEVTYQQREHNWHTMDLLTSMPLLSALMLCSVSMEYGVDNNGHSIEIIMFFLTIFQNVHHITGFMGQYENMKVKKEKFNDYWKNKSFTPLPEQKDISNYSISEYSYHGTGTPMQTNCTPTIATGQIIRLTGSTGAGKTTFVDSLKGVIKGIKLQSGVDPMCFLKQISHMRQDIRDSIPFNEVSIKDLFYQQDEFTIREILNVVGLKSWLTINMENNLDKKINNQISGGQRTLFCLAMSLIDAVEKQMLILDEPEQGLDSELVPATLENAFTWLRSKNPQLRVIFISHLCECVIKRLPKHTHWHIERDTTNGIFTMTIT